MMRSLPQPLCMSTPMGGRKMARIKLQIPQQVNTIAMMEKEERTGGERGKEGE